MIINPSTVFKNSFEPLSQRNFFQRYIFICLLLMDENSRIIHRFRPRPYDLRRKVLLKNFLREQMTYIPPLRGTSETSLEVDDNSNFSGDPTTSIGNEENIDSLKSEHKNAQPIPMSDETPSSSTSADERSIEESLSNDSVASKDSEIPPLKFSLVSSILKLKGSSRKKRKKGISKAKHVYKSVKSPNKSTALGVQSKAKLDSVKPTKEKKSFFSLFKSRKEKRNKAVNAKETASLDAQSASSSSDSVQTTTQSVQTDISWSNTEYNELERSHKCLQEENRLLSESLSFIMSDMDFKNRSQKESSACTDSYEPKTSKEIPTSTDTTSFHREPSEKIAQRSKLLRSKSVQEKGNISRNGLCTRSMNYPGTSETTNNSSPGESSSRDSYLNKSRCLPASPSVHRHSSSYQYSRPSVLKNLPINPGRTIIRRSSMPERASHEPVRSLLRQQSNRNRMYSQTIDSFRNSNYTPYPSNRPKSLPINSFRKSVVRRASMPERMPPNYYRSVQRCRSVNNRDYLNVTNRYSNRSRYVGNCSREVPIQYRTF